MAHTTSAPPATIFTFSLVCACWRCLGACAGVAYLVCDSGLTKDAIFLLRGEERRAGSLGIICNLVTCDSVHSLPVLTSLLVWS